MSAFTALNGGSPKRAESPTITVNTNSLTELPQPDTVEETSQPAPEVSTSHKEWSRSDQNRSSSFPSLRYPDVEGTHKRKRSESDSIEVRPEPFSHGRRLDTSQATLDGYETPNRDHERNDDGARDKETARHPLPDGDDRAHHTPQNSAASVPSQTDEQIGEALRRAATQAGNESDWSNASPEAEDRSVSYGNSYSSEHRPYPIIQHDPKKRKRNFSNRTKTGCLTCRKRKKKCDEQKPECSNCLRGGFLCAGYPPQRLAAWRRPETKPPTVPLESKDPSYVPPGAYGMPSQSHNSYSNQAGGKREPLPHYRGQPLRIDPPQGRPLVSDDDRPTASTLPSASAASPDQNKLSAVSHAHGNVFPTPVSANTQPPPFGERLPKDYQRVPSMHDPSRKEPETPHPSTQLPHIQVMHATRTSSPSAQGSHSGPAAHSGHSGHNSQGGHSHPSASSNTRVTAQLALSHSQYPQRRTQKEEMLAGRHFFPFDKELCLERERCSAACWRFNNLTNPLNGVSAEERQRLFLDILQPREPVRVSPNEASPVTNIGRVGTYVAIETPFNCDYGYNITIGHSVVIGRNCTLNDACEIQIGDNSVLGPNVNVFTATVPIDPKKRLGGQGPQIGRGITIESDCFIGGGVTILPGRTIGKGSTVGAGSVVTKDVPPFTIVAGNPARVLRGVAS